MADEEWAERQRQLTAAGLLVLGKAAQGRIQRLSDISSLIEAAQRSNVTMLNERAVEEMLTLVPTEETIDAPPSIPRSEQATLPNPESQSTFGRTLAPVGTQVLAPRCVATASITTASTTSPCWPRTSTRRSRSTLT